MTARQPLRRVGLIGTRGHVGKEMIALLDNDPTCVVAFLVSKGAVGQNAGEALGVTGRSASLLFQNLSPAEIAASGVDAVVLGLNNGQAADVVAALPPEMVAVDLSADHRFDDAWVYGLTEKNRAAIKGSRRISNPGCYSTAVQLALAPFGGLTISAHAFGVSGYSGAGSSPSTKNDLGILGDSILPYDLIGHTQEREMTRHAGVPVRFFPHVLPFFRGISCTISIDLKRPVTRTEALSMLRAAYDQEPLVDVVDGELPPLVQQVRNNHQVLIGNVVADEASPRLVMVAVVDNLLKGAATQALQNLHLALGVDEMAGLVAATGQG